jgi:hypothetical protein
MAISQGTRLGYDERRVQTDAVLGWCPRIAGSEIN